MFDLPYQEKQIGKNKYRVMALPMLEWAQLSEFLSEVLGAPFAALAKGFDIGDLRELILGDPNALGALATTLSEKITQGRILTLTSLMGHSLEVFDADGNWVKLSQEKQNYWWAQHRSDFPGIVELFLKVQYSGFFTGFAALMPSKKRSGGSQGENTKS